jgi:hypothetical protein
MTPWVDETEDRTDTATIAGGGRTREASVRRKSSRCSGERQLEAALLYWREHPEEIDAAVEENGRWSIGASATPTSGTRVLILRAGE